MILTPNSYLSLREAGQHAPSSPGVVMHLGHVQPFSPRWDTHCTRTAESQVPLPTRVDDSEEELLPSIELSKNQRPNLFAFY